MGCKTVDKPLDERYKNEHELEDKIISKWESNEVLQLISGKDAEGKGGTEIFKRLYENVTGEDFDFGSIPDIRDLKKLNIKTDQMIKQSVKTPGAFAQWFFLPDVIAGKNPISKQAMDGFIINSNYYRGHGEMFDAMINDINSNLMQSMGISGLMDKRSYKQAQKELNTRQKEYTTLMGDVNTQADAQHYRKKYIDPLIKKNELQVLLKAEELFRNPDILKDASKIKQFDAGILEAAKIWHGTGKAGGKGLKDMLYDHLEHGMNSYMKILESAASDYNGFSPIHKQMTKLKDILVKEKDYVPTQLLDLFPQFEGIHQTLHKRNVNSKEIENLNVMVGDMISDIVKDIKVSKNVLPKTNSDFLNNRSRNLIANIDAYAKNVARFNYTSSTTKTLVDALQKFGTMGGSEMEYSARFLSNFLKDTHSTMLGLDVKDSKLRSVSRAITSFEFISKLGLNPRSWTRNATQSVQNINYFGMKGIADTMGTINRHDLKETIDTEMKKQGVFFVNTTNIGELVAPKHTRSNASFDENTGRYVEDYGKSSERLNDMLEDVSKKTGWGMSFIENKFNRQITFKIAFTENYNKELRRKDIVEKKIRQANPEMTGQDIIAAVNKEIVKKSSRVAANAVKDIHFNYEPFMKIKATKSPIGGVLGQYTTYGINSLNYKAKLIKEGMLDMRVGKWGGADAMRMHKLFLTHAMITGVFSPLMNSDMTILYQDDTLDRITNLVNWWGADDDERAKIYHGKGPILSTFGGPFVSDMLTYGQLANVIKMDEDNWATWATGYKQYSPDTDRERRDKLIRTVNTFAGRAFRDGGHIDSYRNGTAVSTLILSELALNFQTKENQKKKDLIQNYTGSWDMSEGVKRGIGPGSIKRRRIQRNKGNYKSPGYDYDAALAVLSRLSV